MLNYPRINEISYRIEGYTGSDSNYRIVKAELFQEGGKENDRKDFICAGFFPEEKIERWSVTVQRKEDDGKDFMQEIMSRIKGYQGTVHFRVLSASINRDTMNLDFVVEDLTEEKKEDERKE